MLELVTCICKSETFINPKAIGVVLIETLFGYEQQLVCRKAADCDALLLILCLFSRSHCHGDVCVNYDFCFRMLRSILPHWLTSLAHP